MESARFLVAEDGTVLVAASMSSHTVYFGVYCRSLAKKFPFDDSYKFSITFKLGDYGSQSINFSPSTLKYAKNEVVAHAER